MVAHRHSWKHPPGHSAHADYVSNSWGSNEGTTTYDGDYNVHCVTITAATGDAGHTATAHWPATLPSVVSVGGTSLTSIAPRVETAWSGAGSGCSKIYVKPSFQSPLNTGCSMRAQAGSRDADPSTGVAVYDTFQEGGWLVFGGTRSHQSSRRSLRFTKSSADPVASLYAHPSQLNDVISRSNGGCGAPLCAAGYGWDGPTGLATPNGI